MDDSNHAGENIKGEINLAVFSFMHQDSIVRVFNNRRNYSLAGEWISESGRDYRFTILTGERWMSGPTNLVYTAPALIGEFLKDKSGMDIDSINLYLDGYLNSQNKKYLREQFKHIPHFTVANFIKKRRNIGGRISKRPRCPAVTYFADVLAHNMLGKSVEDCLTDERYVPFLT